MSLWLTNLVQTLHNSKAFLFCLMLLNEHFVGCNFVVCIVDTWGWESCCCIIAIHNPVLIVTRDLYGFKLVYVDRGKTLVRYFTVPSDKSIFRLHATKVYILISGTPVLPSSYWITTKLWPSRCWEVWFIFIVWHCYICSWFIVIRVSACFRHTIHKCWCIVLAD